MSDSCQKVVHHYATSHVCNRPVKEEGMCGVHARGERMKKKEKA